jgi:MFS family permease
MADVARTADDLRGSPGFGPFWAAATVSSFGTYVTTLAIPVFIVFTLDGGAAEVGLVSAARWLPYPLFGVFAGVFVERARRRPILVTTDFVRCALLVAVPALALAGHLSLVVLVAFMTVFGLASLANDAASQSLLPRLVPPRLLTRANARLDQSDAVAQTSGPLLAGGLVSLLTAPWAVLADAASYFASGLLLLRVPVAEPPTRRLSLRGVRGEAVEGVQWIYRHRTLGPYVLSTHGWFLINAIAGATLPVFALRTIGLSPFRLALALAAAGVGGLLGALNAPALGARFGAGRIVIAGVAGNGLAWALIASGWHGWGGWVVFASGELLLGLTMGAANANEMGYLQSITPDQLQGRTNATRRSVNRAMIVIGAPLGGVLADAAGYRPMLYAAAVGFTLVAAGLAVTPYRQARLDEPVSAIG